MTATTSMSVFCQWLLATPGPLATYSLTLHGDKSVIQDHLLHDLTQYLNEYDEHADGLWLCATSSLVGKVSADPSTRRLIGLPDLAPGEAADSPEQTAATLTALRHKGHMVFCWPDTPWDDLSPASTFHAGIGSTPSIGHRCHITVDPDLIPRSSIITIIGDVFLEWMLEKSATKPELQSLR